MEERLKQFNTVELTGVWKLEAFSIDLVPISYGILAFAVCYTKNLSIFTLSKICFKVIFLFPNVNILPLSKKKKKILKKSGFHLNPC